MPRTARALIDNGIYHVMTRGNNGQVVFPHDADYQRYLALLATCAAKRQVSIYHFVLLPRQVHLLVHAAAGSSLTQVMRSVNLSYGWYYRKRYEYSGHLWQGRFWSCLLEPTSALLALGRSLELKSVYAGLVKDPLVYPWSSYRRYAEGCNGACVTVNPHYDSLGSTDAERQARYRQLPAPHETLVAPRPGSVESFTAGLR